MNWHLSVDEKMQSWNWEHLNVIDIFIQDRWFKSIFTLSIRIGWIINRWRWKIVSIKNICHCTGIFCFSNAGLMIGFRIFCYHFKNVVNNLIRLRRTIQWCYDWCRGGRERLWFRLFFRWHEADSFPVENNSWKWIWIIL